MTELIDELKIFAIIRNWSNKPKPQFISPTNAKYMSVIVEHKIITGSTDFMDYDQDYLLTKTGVLINTLHSIERRLANLKIIEFELAPNNRTRLSVRASNEFWNRYYNYRVKQAFN